MLNFNIAVIRKSPVLPTGTDHVVFQKRLSAVTAGCNWDLHTYRHVIWGLAVRALHRAEPQQW